MNITNRKLNASIHTKLLTGTKPICELFSAAVMKYLFLIRKLLFRIIKIIFFTYPCIHELSILRVFSSQGRIVSGERVEQVVEPI